MTRTAIAVLLAANALVIEHPLLAKAPKAAPSASSPAATAASRPNLVFVLADQLRYQSCGFAGDARARTPNLDTFAKQGVIFRNAVSGHPVCAAYRASLFTGKYTTSTGMVINELRMNPNHDCLAHVLTRGGYDTAYIGKWHLWANELGNHEDPKNSYTPSGPYRLGFDGFWAAYNFHHEYYKGYYHTDSPKKIPVKGYEPDVQTELAIGQIKRHARGGKPFALVLAIGTPHDPWHSNNVPPEYYAMFADQGKEPRFALPPNYKPENDPYSDAWGRFRGPGERQAISHILITQGCRHWKRLRSNPTSRKDFCQLFLGGDIAHVDHNETVTFHPSRYRQNNVETTAGEGGFIVAWAFDPNFSIMGLDDAASDRQAKPRPTALELGLAR